MLSAFNATAEIDKAKWNEGKALFKSNCAACHNPKVDGTGPALMGVTARWEAAGEFKGKTGKQWLYVWIKNWNDPVNAGYKYAMDMANSRPSAMNVFATLKDEDIDKMLLYVENPDFGAAPDVTKISTPAGGEPPKESGSNTTLLIFALFLVVLVAILIGITNKLDRLVAEKNGEVVQESKIPFWKRPKWITAFVLIGIVLVGYAAVDWGTHLGRQQGYQPTQPIKFSHALHAGTHKIECQYCHGSAYKGKHANIPSVNTCMNCHKNIQKGPKYGTEEIAKIYEAVGWDSKSQTYSKTPKPIEWVRIHNLPDHVYFNHAQHVNVGKVQCQTCHGPIETMEEVYQYSPLSMGWCINCHRQTEVQFASNNYYSAYEKIHEDLKNKKLSKVTVETIGGTECQRCHY
ncbi:MAG: c-type cytochrome [Chitinophagales bacterium]|nr:c-type cytochrome [Chitinophagales bacterium]MDW8418179.1 c-type cytochrome [Chitinophagales bacterium]